MKGGASLGTIPDRLAKAPSPKHDHGATRVLTKVSIVLPPSPTVASPMKQHHPLRFERSAEGGTSEDAHLMGETETCDRKMEPRI
jgi:hypothetical protein